MLSCLYIATLWSPAGKGLTSWLLFLVSNCYFVTLPCRILGQMLYLIVMIPDLCRLSYFHSVDFVLDSNNYSDILKGYFIC